MNDRTPRPTQTRGKGKKASNSSKGRNKAVLPPRPAAEVHVDAHCVFGADAASNVGDRLGLVLDGALVATDVVGDGGAFRIGLPPHSLGLTLEVLHVETGRSLTPAPLSLGAVHRIEWLGWSCSGGVISGAFRVAAPPDASDEAVLLVQALKGDALFLQAFAKAEIETGGEAASGTVFRFSGFVHRLLNQSETVIILPIVAGMQLNEPLRLAASDIGFIGHVDATDQPMAQGWAINLTDPARRAEIELRLNGRVVGTTTADIHRDDLMLLGLSDGASGFRLAFPPDIDRRMAMEVRAFIAGTEAELVDSPYIVPALPAVLGYFDAVYGPFAGGWAVNMIDPGTPLKVEAVCDGEVIGTGFANLYRGDVESAGLPTPWCGFRIALANPLSALLDRDIVVRVVGTDEVIDGSPRQVTRNNNMVRFLSRGASIAPASLQRLARRMTMETAATRISIIMPIYNTKREWLLEAVNSVLGQWSANWELICVDDGSTEPHVSEILTALSRHDARVRVIRSPGNMGIAGATNLGLRAARGAYVAYMDHDDFLEPDAVHKLALAAQQTGADLIYSDEVVTSEEIDSVLEVRARPAFSHDYYLSHPYFVHLVCVKTSLAHALGGWDERLSISGDVDFVLRAIERAETVAHVPAVLYRWRTHGASAGHQKLALVTETTTAILNRHLERLGRKATASPGLGFNQFRVDWEDDGGEVLIIIPTRNRVDLLRKCIDSIEKTSKGANYRIVVIDHQSTDKKTLAYLKKISVRHTIMPYSGIFNYAKMNNVAARLHGGDAKHILFLNNDVEAFEDGWMQRLRSLSARPEVGAVGPMLLYGNNLVQHAGVLIAFNGAADHAFKMVDAFTSTKERARRLGYNCSLTALRDFSAVTAACVMIRHEVFKEVGGFDERFVIGFNDTDLCLRIGEAGYKVLYDGYSVLYHHESATRIESKSVDHPEDDARLRTRWARFFKDGDPFYSKLLAPKGMDHVLRQDDGCKGRMTARVVRLRPPHPPTVPPRRGRTKRKIVSNDA
jgi:GT2 family glycosyltransferase